MTSSTPATIVSGVTYEIRDVAGAVPAELTHFVGNVTFVVHGSTGDHEVSGQGTQHDDVVRFHEKWSHGEGKDVRVWTVCRTAEGRFVADSE